MINEQVLKEKLTYLIKMNSAKWFDIEVDFDPDKGFSPTSDPFNPVTAISCYLDWLDQCITLVIAPKHMSSETAQEITNEFENTMLFKSYIGNNWILDGFSLGYLHVLENTNQYRSFECNEFK